MQATFGAGRGCAVDSVIKLGDTQQNGDILHAASVSVLPFVLSRVAILSFVNSFFRFIWKKKTSVLIRSDKSKYTMNLLVHNDSSVHSVRRKIPFQREPPKSTKNCWSQWSQV